MFENFEYYDTVMTGPLLNASHDLTASWLSANLSPVASVFEYLCSADSRTRCGFIIVQHSLSASLGTFRKKNKFPTNHPIKMIAIKFCFILVVLVVFHQAASAFVVQDCASSSNRDANLVSMKVDSCPDESADRCSFIKGSNATLKIDFIPSK